MKLHLFIELGRQCHARAEYLKGKLAQVPGLELPYGAPTFNEFVVRRTKGDAAPMLAAMQAKGILAGVDLGRWDPALKDRFVVAVTERHTRGDLDRLVEALGAA